MSTPIDFDGEALKLFEAAWDASDDYQGPRDTQYTRDYQNFHAFLDMSQRNPGRSNVTIPKIRSIIMTKGPQEIKAAIGRRPYIPFDSQREEYSALAGLSSKMLDQMLYISGFFNEFVLADLMKITYGTAFMECIPYFKTEWRKIVNPIIEAGPNGEPIIKALPTQMVPIKLLRFALRTFGPWEVKVDPFATGLENETQCRYAIKVRITSKRLVKKLALEGAYGKGFDVDQLDHTSSNFGSDINKQRGLQMLSEMGLGVPKDDTDMCVLFNYESPGRYIDVINDSVVLRDRPNPYACKEAGHGLINLSRMVHDVDPHTQARFWGNGDAKANEILQALLNDLWNLTLDNHNFGNEGMTYYATGRGVTPEKLVKMVGNKVGFDLPADMRIQDVIMETYGHPLPPEHYLLREQAERYMDLTARKYKVGYGESEEGQQTLGEIQNLKEVGDETAELNVKNIEDPFLADFGRKCLCHIDQFSRFDDKKEILGERDAMRLVLINPRDLPGGYDFTFTGSDRIVNQMIKQRNLMALDESISNSPYVKPREWMVKKLTAFEMGDEVDNILKTEEELQQEQMAEFQVQMMMQQQQVQQTAQTTEQQTAQKHQMDLEKIETQAKMKQGVGTSPAKEATNAGMVR